MWASSKKYVWKPITEEIIEEFDSPYRPYNSMYSLFVELVYNILYFNNYVVSV